MTMLEPFANYFHQIEMPQPIIDRAEAICATFGRFIPGTPTAVFVADAYEQPTNARRYTSLWLFAGKTLMESKQFIVNSNLDFIPLDRVEYVELVGNGIDNLHGPFTAGSTLRVTIRFRENVGAILMAANNNCAFLSDFLANVIFTNALRNPS
jgi:hypothetical protein